MYKISDVKIWKFWNRYDIALTLNEDVNIIIGKNGTGKTTFINILNAVLSVDVYGLYENDFQAVEIKLTDGKRRKTVRATKKDPGDSPFLIVEYQISRKKYRVRLIAMDEARSYHRLMHRRAVEEAEHVRVILSELVTLTSISVDRLRREWHDRETEREMRGKSSVDIHLQGLLKRLGAYNYEMTARERDIASELQKKVLVSLLYTRDSDDLSTFDMQMDEKKEWNDLITAYTRLGITGADVRKRIKEHVNSIGETIRKLEELEEHKEAKEHEGVNIAPLVARNRTKYIVDMSLDAEERIKAVYRQSTLFLDTTKRFIEDKVIKLDSNGISAEADEEITAERLSSGEKQLLIFLIEALLQREKRTVFLADEPELSLHVAWQRQILPAVRELNPNAQIIAATHSPEIAGKFKKSLIDMEDVVYGGA